MLNKGCRMLNPPRLAVLFILPFLSIAAGAGFAAESPSLWLADPSPDKSHLPLFLPGQYVRPGQTGSYQAGSVLIDQTPEGSWLVWTADRRPRRSRNLVDVKPTDQRIALKDTGEGWTIHASGIEWQFGKNGHLGQSGASGSVAMAGRNYRLDHHGAAVIVFVDEGATHQVRFAATGAVELVGYDQLLLEGLSRQVQSRKATYGIISPVDRQPLVYPSDWAWVGDGKVGMAVVPMPQTTLRIGDDRVAIQDGQAVALLPTADPAEAQAARESAHHLLVLRGGKDADRFESVLHPANFQIRVLDRNDDGPDFSKDLWALRGPKAATPWVLVSFHAQAQASGSEPRLAAAFYTLNTDQPLAAELQTIAGPRQDLDRAALAEVGAFSDGHEDSNGQADGAKPRAIVLDTDSDGRLLRGHALLGGYLASGEILRSGKDRLKAWDLNADGRCDVFDYGLGKYIFNFTGHLHSLLGLDIDVLAGEVTIREESGYGLQEQGSMFKHTGHVSRKIGQAYRSFEEHFFVDLKPGENPGLPEGGNFFFYTIDAGDVNRMTMGRLSGAEDLRAWEIELDPTPADLQQTYSQVVTYRTPSGEQLQINSMIIPRQWDGRVLGPRGFLDGWYDMAEAKYPTARLQATFAPPGAAMGASEGMYGGSLTTQERIEVDTDGGTYTFYYSPLMGGLHLKGADYGAYAIPARTPDFFLDINRYYHAEAHEGSNKFVGAEPAIRFRQREAKRMEGPVYLSYADRDGDGYFDTYIYDQDNDGVYERRLSYSDELGLMRLTQQGRTSAWPERVSMEQLKFLPEHYAAFSRMYRRGTNLPPRIVSTSLGSNGTPMRIQTEPFFREVQPAFFVSFDRSWTPVVAANATHAAPQRYRWTDFRASGLSRVGSMFTEAGFDQQVVDQPWTDQLLGDVDVLVIADLNRMPADEEIQALQRWIRQGGYAVLSVPHGPTNHLRFNALGRMLGFELADQSLEKRTTVFRWASLGPINDPRTRAAEHRRPAPWNQVRHFGDPQNLGLLDGLEYLSFVGFPIAGDDQWQPLLTYDNHTIMATRRIGQGMVLLSGADWWTNRYIWHHESYEAGTSNDLLIQRIIEHLADKQNMLRISRFELTDNRHDFIVQGRGGKIWLARKRDPRATGLARIGNEIELPPRRELEEIHVNGQPVDYVQDGPLRRIELPSGQSHIQMIYQVER
jgi:hypothetical protein